MIPNGLQKRQNKCSYLFDISAINRLFVESYLMKTELHTQQLDDIQHLERLRAHYKFMADRCEDVVKQLIGYTPDEFSFTFTIKQKAVIEIPITKDNATFCLGTFMSWAGYYKQQLRRINEQLHNLTVKVA